MAILGEINEGVPTPMMKVHELHPPRKSHEPEIQERLIWRYSRAVETTYWGRPATLIEIDNGVRIYVAESLDDLTNLWLRI